MGWMVVGRSSGRRTLAFQSIHGILVCIIGKMQYYLPTINLYSLDLYNPVHGQPGV